MKVGFLITARLKSARLPMKLLKEVNGDNFLSWMIKRLKLSKELDTIVVCTSTNPQDDPIIEIAERNGVKHFRGSEEDVIDRLYQAAIINALDFVINMTADCPMIPIDLIPQMISVYERTQADMVHCHHLPPGLFLTGLKPEAMKRVKEIKASENTEYWLYYFLKTNLFHIEKLIVNEDWLGKKIRAVLDYPEDYEFLKALFEGLGPNAYRKSTNEIIMFMDENPELADINWKCNEAGAIRTKNDPTSKVFLQNGKIIE